jgi:Protein of unknown function (DUF1573)
MKALQFCLIVILALASCNNDNASKPQNALDIDIVNNPRSAEAKGTTNVEDLGSLQFVDTTHNFGKLKEGDIVEYDFAYTNKGKRDVIISEARASCGCTVPEYKHEAIAVAETGSIKVKFNSEGKHGMQHKTVLVTTNGYPGEIRLNINAEVK